jgi:hypothetical protein
MRVSLILALLIGLLGGFLLGNQGAISQEDSLPSPGQDGGGRYQIAGHSTYPPLLLDTETGTSWILMSTTDEEERRWIWEPIEMGILTAPPSQSNGRYITRMAPPSSIHQRQGPPLSTSRPLTW